MKTTNVKISLHPLIAICALSALTGCGQKEPANVAAGRSGIAPAMTIAAMAPPAQQAEQPDTLAYEHTISIETTRELLASRLREVETACNADRASGCTILEVSLQSQQELPTGSIRMRLAPAGVEPM